MLRVLSSGCTAIQCLLLYNMHKRYLQILVIEDQEADRFMIDRALRRNGLQEEIQFAFSGEEAIAYFEGQGKYADRTLYPFPTIVLTDLKMPHGDGFSVLEYLKSKPESKIIPVLVLSASADRDDVKRSYAMGASCYLRKPADIEELGRILKLFYDFWMECEIPVIDTAGKQVQTSSQGKLGERFGPVE